MSSLSNCNTDNTRSVTLSNITKIGLIVYIEDPKKALGVDYIYIEENTKVKETTMANIVITSYFIRSNTIFAIN